MRLGIRIHDPIMFLAIVASLTWWNLASMLRTGLCLRGIDSFTRAANPVADWLVVSVTTGIAVGSTGWAVVLLVVRLAS